MDAGKTPLTAGSLGAVSKSTTACECLFVEVTEGTWPAVEMQGTMGVGRSRENDCADTAIKKRDFSFPLISWRGHVTIPPRYRYVTASYLIEQVRGHITILVAIVQLLLSPLSQIINAKTQVLKVHSGSSKMPKSFLSTPFLH